MDWLTSLFDIFQVLGTSGGHWLYFSLIPVLFGIVQSDSQPGAEDSEDDLPGDPGEFDQDDSGSDREPFIKGSKSVYFSPEETVKGLDEKDRVIEERSARLKAYEAYGSPEEIAALRESAGLVKNLQNALNGGTKQQQEEAYAKLSPADREKFQNFDIHYRPELAKAFVSKEEFDKAGYVRQEDLSKYFDARDKENQAKSAAGEILKERGMEANPRIMAIVNATVRELAGYDQNLYNQIIGKYEAGDVKGAVSAAMDVVYGPVKSKPAGDRGQGSQRERDGNGRFVDRTAQDKAKRQAAGLPEAPPAGGGSRVTEGEGNQPSKTPQERTANAVARLVARRQQRESA